MGRNAPRAFPDDASRIRAMVRVNEFGCWEWTGKIGPDGYAFCHSYAANNWFGAHRLAYVTFVGEIPRGLQLDHLCRVRHCVNPAHLEPVTPSENTRRSYAARRRLRELQAA